LTSQYVGLQPKPIHNPAFSAHPLGKSNTLSYNTEDQLKESLRLLESGQNRVDAAYTHLAWGSVCRERGNPTTAREHWALAATQFKASDLLHELGRTNALLEDLGSPPQK
jgi:hypothetical protein